MVQINLVKSKWELEKPKYEEIAKYAVRLLRQGIARHNINVEITWRIKDLVSLIKKIKKKQHLKEYSYDSVTDKLGIRIICSFNNELEIIDQLISDAFVIVNRDLKRENQKFNSLDYTSNHYDVYLKTEDKKIKDIESASNLIFEIQSRTINQDTWAKIVHKLSYKNESGLSNSLNRSIYRLLALYELADDEFNRVNKHLQEQPENITYALIRKLEKFVYRYSDRDFDREISEYYIQRILNFIGKKNTISIVNKVEEFVQAKEASITDVYSQEDIYQHENFWLTTQPEVFLIWYCIDNHYYLIRDNWGEDFDFQELEFLANIWGKSVNK